MLTNIFVTSYPSFLSSCVTLPFSRRLARARYREHILFYTEDWRARAREREGERARARLRARARAREREGESAHACERARARARERERERERERRREGGRERDIESQERGRSPLRDKIDLRLEAKETSRKAKETYGEGGKDAHYFIVMRSRSI